MLQRHSRGRSWRPERGERSYERRTFLETREELREARIRCTRNGGEVRKRGWTKEKERTRIRHTGSQMASVCVQMKQVRRKWLWCAGCTDGWDMDGREVGGGIKRCNTQSEMERGDLRKENTKRGRGAWRGRRRTSRRAAPIKQPNKVPRSMSQTVGRKRRRGRTRSAPLDVGRSTGQAGEAFAGRKKKMD